MAHISLYRRYRPDTFDKVIGQEHIVRTLINQVKTDNISHAYLFTGTRGTGKTSVARIFARAMNCLQPVNGSPCGKCENCVELMNPNNMDIIEIDAASNSTVDEIRDLREKVKYPPVVGRYKVYIVDEVHMLSANAFNALLKTLEEPPSHVVFILATTDVHKLPATILSRCMRFDFKLLSIIQLSENLKAVFNDIGKKYSEEAVTLIAAAAEGSARDSLSIADMCVAFSDKEITYNDVLEVLGASDPNVIIKLAGAVIGRDISSALEIIDGLSNYGKNISVLSKDVALYIRNILYIKNCKTAESALRLPKDIFTSLKALSDKADSLQLLGILDLFNGINGELRYSTQPRIMFEAAVVRACTESGITELAARIKRLEERQSSGQADAEAQKKSPEPVGKTDVNLLWGRCRTELIGKDKYYALGIPMNKYGKITDEGNNILCLSFSAKADAVLLTDAANKKVIEDKLLALSGIPYKIRVEIAGEDDNSADIAGRLKKLFGDDFKETK